MNIYLMRHGLAVDVGEKGVGKDFARMLSADGRRKTRILSKMLVRAGVQPERLFTSPLVRAVETAGIFSDEAGNDLIAEPKDFLKPNVDFSEVTSFLGKISAKSLMLIGHEPDLSSLAWYWIAGSGRPGLLMRQAGVCCISFGPRPARGQGCLLWHLNPAMMLKIAQSD